MTGIDTPTNKTLYPYVLFRGFEMEIEEALEQITILEQKIEDMSKNQIDIDNYKLEYEDKLKTYEDRIDSLKEHNQKLFLKASSSTMPTPVVELSPTIDDIIAKMEGN